MGLTGMRDRSSRPHRSPNRTPQRLVKKIVHRRWKQRLGPVAIGAELAMPASTVHAVLVRCRLNRLRHVDVKSGHFNPKLGTAFVHTVIDDHSRVVYAEIHDDEKAITAIGVLQRAVSWFAARGVTVERVLSDNGSAYKSHAWRVACAELEIKHKRTRAYRPQTNGKIERFHRTLADGWAFTRHYNSESARRAALPAWLHTYNHHRPHTAIKGLPPISRLTNLPRQHTYR